jgi:hypothetical protein
MMMKFETQVRPFTEILARRGQSNVGSWGAASTPTDSHAALQAWQCGPWNFRKNGRESAVS